METELVQVAAQYAEEMLGKEGFRYVCAVVASCKMLAVEMESQDEGKAIDMEALVLAGYLHDISTVTHGFLNHHVKSAEVAGEFLRKHEMAAERISKVEKAILAHTSNLSLEDRTALPVEALILYDADKLGRLSGLAVVTSLIEFGARYPNRSVTGDVLAAILRHMEERFVDLYQSLNTQPAREMAKDKFGRTLAFLDGVIEHLSDATPV